MVLTSFFVLAAIVSLVAGLALPGTSFILMCLSIAFSGGAFVSRAVGGRGGDFSSRSHDTGGPSSQRRAGQEPHHQDSEQAPSGTGGAGGASVVPDERWDRLLTEPGTVRTDVGSGENPRAAVPTATELEQTVARLIAGHVRAEVETIRAELRQTHRELTTAIQQWTDELAEMHRQVPARVGEVLTRSQEEVLRRSHEEATRVGDRLEPKVDRLLSLQSSGPAAGNEELGSKISELSRMIGSLSTRSEVAELTATWMGELRSLVASLADDFHGLQEAVSSNDEHQAELALGMTTLQAELERLARRPPPRSKPMRLEEGQIALVAEAVRAALAPTRPEEARDLPGADGEGKKERAPAKRARRITAEAAPAKTAATTAKRTTAKRTVAKSAAVDRTARRGGS